MDLQLLSDFKSPFFGIKVMRPLVTPFGKDPSVSELQII
jgi:hypothetical protein